MGQFRGAQIYVQGQTRYRLNLLARIVQPKPGTILPVGTHPSAMTADELADSLLTEIMLTKYPALSALEAQIKVLEEAASEAIRDSGEKDAQAVPRRERTDGA